jgi:cysteate synthase
MMARIRPLTAISANEDGSLVMTDAVLERRHYSLVCPWCGRHQNDDGLVLDCAADHPPALLQTEYLEQEFSPRRRQDGLSRYQDWLPVARIEPDAGRTAVYRSPRLSRVLGLPNLWIAFNGYWPERGAFLETATFKELEAYTVLGRLPARPVTLTVASSGNTGAAFAWACSRRQMPCLLVVPGRALGRLSFRAPLHRCVHLVSIEDGDYPDAIEFVARLATADGCQPEGGVKNVGRRDGLATVLLAAYEEMRCLPDFYFQAVGSGTGAIAVHEAAKRLRAAAGDLALPRLMLCQNAPFTPIYDLWQAAPRPAGHFRSAIRQVFADELTNWSPPYAVRGGVHDALAESGGEVLLTGNAAAQAAAQLFQDLEGIDIEPAAAVALACLRDAAAGGRLDRQASVLLNVTGGGRRRASQDHQLVPAEPQLRLTRASLASPETADRLAALGVLGVRGGATAPAV